ncbi:MAG: MnhB domain-containing protein [Candidatus Omnitrophica bacterium]|nr:MnhB domain-containing protein [Candidatus Omnitrophota bacterium]MDD5352503.1 MnhB domain-containing protein [Candidatus Omnitrophota bacterium]MDD5550101.1 MnhB domain-containing protein [Candidatus Omnitrophota bacterium]
MVDSNKKEEIGMSFMVKTVTRLTAVVILLFGIYIVLHGHISPGGGFAGGLIIALSFVQVMIAFGKDIALRKLSEAKAAVLESVGGLLFLTIAALGFLGGHFLINFFASKGRPFTLFSAGTIPFYNIAIAIKVAVGLFSIFIVLVILKRAKKEE